MQRKTVTLVFCDVTGSSALGEALDPETVREVMSRYFATARAVLERHGGTVEKFVGDAVMAAFGIPAVHEDDAVRAVRAADELRRALAALNDDLGRELAVRIAVRTGVNTGEVVAGDPSLGQDFATGEAVVIAQRLESAAEPDTVLLGDATYALVRDLVDVEPLPPLEVKGRTHPVGAWRLTGVREGTHGVARRLDSPLVGRDADLAALVDAFRNTVAARACRVVTVLGDAGVGKSRLAAELARVLEDEADVLEGRCLPYGQGITYWPVVEVVRAAAGIGPAEPAEESRERIAHLLGDAPEAAEVTARLADAVGLGDNGFRSDEIAWAVRRLLETLSRRRPLLVVLDDLHWAEPTLLDLVEYLTGWASDAPVLLCCLARPDLLEHRPGWRGAVELQLAPLTRDESEALVESLLGRLEAGAAADVIRLAEGNPLFVEEIVRMLVEDESLVASAGVWRRAASRPTDRVPATIQAVLAARLDLLPDGERRALQRAAVVGQRFWWDAIVDLSPAEEQGGVAGRLHALVRRRLLRPDESRAFGTDGLRFGHVLVRDTVYESIPKRERAALHESFADWVEARSGSGLAQYDEILGYHLEQAHRYRTELGPPDESADALGVRASERLATAGRRALNRGDAHAAHGLLSRAVALGRGPDVQLRLDLVAAQRDEGALADAAASLADASVVSAGAADTARVEVERGWLAFYTDPSTRFDALLQVARDAAPVLRDAGDEIGLVRALTLEAYAHFTRCNVAEMESALHPALDHAERCGDRRSTVAILAGLARAGVVGPTPVEDALRRCDEVLERGPDSRWLLGVVAGCRGYLAAMAGRPDDAREHFATGESVLSELGHSIALGGVYTYAGAAELLAGDPAAAERELRMGLALLESIEETGNLSTLAAVLAEAVLRLGRLEEAEELTRLSESTASADDATSQVGWRTVRALAAAGRGDVERGLALAHEAVALASPTDAPNVRGAAYEALAAVLGAAGDAVEAAAARDRARDEHRAKGNVAALAAAPLSRDP